MGRLLLLIIFSLIVSLNEGFSLKVVNNVAPCAGDSYCTIKLFSSEGAQTNICQGQNMTFSGLSSIPEYTGLGIQENGMYCRCCGDESGCINPDNAGMQFKFLSNPTSCHDYQLNDPFYCGIYPPIAKAIVNVVVSGTWPDCVITLTRLPNAPGCSGVNILKSACPQSGIPSSTTSTNAESTTTSTTTTTSTSTTTSNTGSSISSTSRSSTGSTKSSSTGSSSSHTTKGSTSSNTASTKSSSTGSTSSGTGSGSKGSSSGSSGSRSGSSSSKGTSSESSSSSSGANNSSALLASLIFIVISLM
jgi:hypothetical protein